MANKTIAVLEGDGIGPEIMREGLKVLKAVSDKYSHNFDLNYVPFGAKAYFEHGHPFPDMTREAVMSSDSVLKGPIGLAQEDMKRIPIEFSPEGAGLLPLRKMLDTYANFRPVYLPKEFAFFSPLRSEIIGEGIDIMMIRELVGGNYFGAKVEGKDTDWNFASDDGSYYRNQIERIARVAFEEAYMRRSKLTSVSKPNVMAQGRLWDKVVDDIHGSSYYYGIKLERVIVDNMAFQLMVNPSQYNGVVLMENMQGDILTDQAGGILGSLGLMPTACLNPQTGKGYFEPAHGSAPNIAGKNVANPYSMIGSVALMLDKAFGLEQESRDIWDGLKGVFSQGFMTQELKSKNTPLEKVVSTSEFGDMVRDNILRGVRD